MQNCIKSLAKNKVYDTHSFSACLETELIGYLFLIYTQAAVELLVIVCVLISTF